MIQALLLVASILGASVYYWQHNKHWSYVQTVNPHVLVGPRYDVHPITYNYCAWPNLQPDEPDIQQFLRRRIRRPVCRPTVEVEWEDGRLRVLANSEMSCIASDLTVFSANRLSAAVAIKLEPESLQEIPYTNFAVECHQNGRLAFRKTFYSHKMDTTIGEFEAMESTETNPSIAVLYFKSISYAQLQRDFPKTVKTTGKLGFYSFSMFNKMSGDVDDIVNGTFYNEDVRHAIGEYMRKERFCKVFTNTNRTGIESDYSLTEFTRSLPFDSCSDDNTIAERLIEAWTRFSIDNTDNCYLSHIFVNNTYWSKSLDSTLSHAMIQFQLNNVFQKTLVLILSAEGIPVGQFGNSYTGKVEERNPILLAHVPPKLRTLYPDHVFQIEQNQNKLITHKDVFELLNSFVRLSKGQTIQPTDPEFVEWRMEHKRGVSLWQSLLPTKRTCVEAMIPDEFCLCMEHMLEQERIYNETDNMAATLYQKMDTEIRARHPCIQETTRVADRNYTLVHNLNSAILNGTDEYVEFLLFTVHAYSNGLSAEKNFFISVNGQFKHMLNGERDIRQAYPYVTDGTGSMCMAGFMDRFCEMCHRKFYMSPP